MSRRLSFTKTTAAGDPGQFIDDSLIQEKDELDPDENIDDSINIDKIFKSLKSYGNYQIFFFITCQIMSISNAMSMVAGFFRLGNLVPDYSCADEGNIWTLEAATVKKNSTFACLMVRNCTQLSTKNHWYSMYEEFEWVCEKDHFRATIQSLLPIGVFFGFMISGHISDYFGRKWIMFIGEVYSLVSGIICAWSPSFSLYLWIAAVGSLISPIGASASFSLIVESVNPKYRLLQGFSFQYSIGLMKLECYKFKGKAIPAKHQEKYDSLKSKFDEQCKLRSLCWFKYIFCAPKSIVSEDDANDANSQVDNESSETVDVESVSSSESESETESDFSSNEDKNSDDFSDSDSDDSDSDSSVTDSGDSDVSFIDDKKSIDEKVGEDKKIKTIKSMPETFKLGRNTPKFAKIKNDMFNVNEKTSAEDREVQVAALTIKEEIKNRQIEPTFKKSETTKNVGADKENDEFENLKIQLVEIKAENAKLKSSVEKLFASQTVF